MQHKIKLIIALIIAIFPFNSLRTLGYKLLFKYTIINSKIGWLCIINIDSAELNHATISSFNLFTGPFKLKMEAGSNIGSFNYFKCGQWAKKFSSTREFFLDKEALITTQHLFDVFGNISIGKKTFIAGSNSQFWTHGSMSNDIDIKIGDDCYIGSAVRFTPGVNIPNKTLCAIGSVVTKKFKQENSLIAGVPAKMIKENINWRENWK